MDRDELLTAYDERLRETAEVTRARAWEKHGPVLWAEFFYGGFVTYRDLQGLEGEPLDRLIAETVDHFRDDTSVSRFEWKTRGHDAPDDLGERLVAHGLVAEERETVMIGEAERLAVEVPLDAGIVVRQAGDGGELMDDLRRLIALQEGVFGLDRGPRLEESLAELEGGDTEFWLAEAEGDVVCAGRLTVVPGTDFAGVWGGGTAPEWRGRGIYRALVSARASSALERGVRFIHSDCTDMSRPILERSGLRAVTTTTPYVWTRRA